MLNIVGTTLWKDPIIFSLSEIARLASAYWRESKLHTHFDFNFCGLLRIEGQLQMHKIVASICCWFMLEAFLLIKSWISWLLCSLLIADPWTARRLFSNGDILCDCPLAIAKCWHGEYSIDILDFGECILVKTTGWGMLRRPEKDY